MYHIVSCFVKRRKTCSETKVEKYQKITGIHYLQMGASIPSKTYNKYLLC